MASITIRNLDDSIKAKLRLQAAEHGLSMEQEAREILRNSLSPDADPINEARSVDSIASVLLAMLSKSFLFLRASDALVMFDQDFAACCLLFDGKAAFESAHLSAQTKNAVMPISTADAQIAAIALCHQLPLIIRNTKTFLESAVCK